MKIRLTKKAETTLQELIDTAHTQLFSLSIGTPEYKEALDELDRLYKLKNLNKGFAISPDALIAVFGNLAGILLILNFERIGVVTTKALGFILKARV